VLVHRLLDFFIQACNGFVEWLEHGRQAATSSRAWGDDPLVGGQGLGLLHRLEPLLHEAGTAAVVLNKRRLGGF